MENNGIFLSQFFARLIILVGFLAIGCASREVVDPLEKTSEEGDLYFEAGFKGDE